MTHKKVKHKPIQIQSINMSNKDKICDLEGFFLVIQELLQEQIKNCRKGKILSSEYRLSYKKAQGILFDLHSYFGLKGCFSFGTCETCKKFDNGSSSTGIIGDCKNQKRMWCDSCDQHSNIKGEY